MTELVILAENWQLEFYFDNWFEAFSWVGILTELE